MHYINIEEIPRLTKGMGDSSGVYIHYSTKAQLKIAGMISLHVRTNVPPLSRSFQDATCTLQEDKVRQFVDEYKLLSFGKYVLRVKYACEQILKYTKTQNVISYFSYS